VYERQQAGIVKDVRLRQWWDSASAGEGIVGGPAPRSWRPAFVFSLTAVALSLGVLVVVVFSALSDDEASGSTLPVISRDGPAPTETPTPVEATPTPRPATPAAPAATNPPQTSTTAPATGFGEVLPCGNILVPLDKEHRLPEDCAPGDLVALPGNVSYAGQQLMRATAAAAFVEMATAAANDGRVIVARSTYRSYATQAATWDDSVRRFGLEYTTRTVARPGHSEHQLGTTADVTSASAGYELEGFEDTVEARWVEENSWRHGFIISYPAGKEGVTGYAYEAWHVRFVGKDVAASVHSSGLTLGEYLLRR
jgi:D-alanyl-D-alanine carboxypeptidase